MRKIKFRVQQELSTQKLDIERESINNQQQCVQNYQKNLLQDVQKENSEIRSLKISNRKMVKGPWTHDEDEILKQEVFKCGAQNWSIIAKKLPGRIGKQCRERWHNHLNPNVKKERWSKEEDLLIKEAHKMYTLQLDLGANGAVLPNYYQVELIILSKITGILLQSAGSYTLKANFLKKNNNKFCNSNNKPLKNLSIFYRNKTSIHVNRKYNNPIRVILLLQGNN